MSLTWTVAVKWNGTDAVDEVAYMISGRLTRGRRALLDAGADGYMPQEIGECILTMGNSDGRYDPLNASSAIYPNCAPGKVVTLTVSDGTPVTLFTGHITNIQPIRGSGGANTKRVRITIRDGWQWLQDRKIRYAPSADVATHTAIGNLATAAQYPFATDISDGVDIVPYWWAGNRSARDEIQSLSDSEFGLVWVAPNGALTFRPRPYQWSIASSATWTGAEMTEIDFAQPWDVIRNVVQVKVYPTEVIANGDGGNTYLWRNAKTFKLRPTKSVTLNVDYSYEGQPTSAINIVAPVPNTDYRAFENKNGTGTNLTANLTVTLTAKGTDAQIVLTNDSATRDAYVTLLQVRGDVVNVTDALIVEKDTSGGTNRRTFLLDVPWQQDLEKAQLYADYLAGLLDEPRAAPVIRTNTQKAGLAKQVADLNTVHTLNITSLSINAAYRRCGVMHEWHVSNQNLIWSEIYFETRDATSYWHLNTSQLNTTTVLAF